MSLDPKLFPAIPAVQSDVRPFWSVVIPAYKPEYLAQAIRSVLDQDPGPEQMEILVIDDCSPHGLEPIVRQAGGDRVTYVRQSENLGTHATENAGLIQSRGIWTHILNDDDWVLPGFYQTFQNALKDQPAKVGVACCAHRNTDRNGGDVWTPPPIQPSPGILPDWLVRMGTSNQVHPVSVVVRRSVYEHVGGYHLHLSYCADWEFNKRSACFYDWWYEPQRLACYRMHRGGLTAQMRLAGGHIDDLLRSIEISETYLPAELNGRITTASREYYALCALNDALAFLQKGMTRAAIRHVQGAFRLTSDPRTVEEFVRLLSHPVGEPLRKFLPNLFSRIDATSKPPDVSNHPQ